VSEFSSYSSTQVTIVFSGEGKMKAKLIFTVLMLSLASVSFGDLLLLNFEGDGQDYGNGFSGTITTNYATLGNNSMDVVSGGGWVGLGEVYIAGTPAQAALASTGKVKIDLTAIPVQPDGWWGDIGLVVNAGGEVPGGFWTATAWIGSTPIGSTTEITFQLPSDIMAMIPQFNWWCNIGLQTMSRGTESYIDDITGETIITYDGTIHYYIDNVRIVPEPATLAMLGLGGLLLRRKR
jgi:hypothetical protein